jgi:hypothetical protein
MQSAELRELTASEELTLEEEYAMQRESSAFNLPPLVIRTSHSTEMPTQYGT